MFCPEGVSNATLIPKEVSVGAAGAVHKVVRGVGPSLRQGHDHKALAVIKFQAPFDDAAPSFLRRVRSQTDSSVFPEHQHGGAVSAIRKHRKTSQEGVPCSFRDRIRKRGLLKGTKVGFVDGHRRKIGRVPKDEVSTLEGLVVKIAQITLSHVAVVTLVCKHAAGCSHGVGVNVTPADGPPVCGHLEQQSSAANPYLKRCSPGTWSEVEQGSRQ